MPEPFRRVFLFTFGNGVPLLKAMAAEFSSELHLSSDRLLLWSWERCLEMRS